jgi:ankyrin repeat protein
LTENGFKADYRFANGSTLLHQYFKDKKKCSDNGSYLNYLLEGGADVNAKDNEGSTALFCAI